MPVERLPSIICVAGETERYHVSKDSAATGKTACCNSHGSACVSAPHLLCLAHALFQ